MVITEEFNKAKIHTSQRTPFDAPLVLFSRKLTKNLRPNVTPTTIPSSKNVIE